MTKIPCRILFLVATCILSMPTPSYSADDSLNRHESRRLVELMYEGILFRNGDVPGSNFWTDYLVENGYSGLLNASKYFVNGDEFTKIVLKKYSAEDVIRHLYHVFFRRDPEPSAISWWGGFIVNDRAAEAINGIVGSQEFYKEHLQSLGLGEKNLYEN